MKASDSLITREKLPSLKSYDILETSRSLECIRKKTGLDNKEKKKILEYIVEIKNLKIDFEREF